MRAQDMERVVWQYAPHLDLVPMLKDKRPAGRWKDPAAFGTDPGERRANAQRLLRYALDKYGGSVFGMLVVVPDGVMVLDVDQHDGGEDGRATWDTLREQYGMPSLDDLAARYPAVDTPSGNGLHLWMADPGEDMPSLPGIDVKRGRTLVALPCSDGYALRSGHDMDSLLDPKPAPDMLAQAFVAHAAACRPVKDTPERAPLPKDDKLRQAFDAERDGGEAGTHQECPLCGSDTGFQVDDAGRWFCHSTNHGPRLKAAGIQVGRVNKHGQGWGDSTDLAAHAAGMSLVEYVRSKGHETRSAGGVRSSHAKRAREQQADTGTQADDQPQRPVLVDLDARYRDVTDDTRDDGVLVNNLLARGRITNLAATPKAGKSTWLLAALAGFGAAQPREVDGYGAPESPLRTLYLSENHPDDDAVTHAAFNPRQEYGRHAHGGVVTLDRTALPDGLDTWQAMLEYVAGIVQRDGFDVVVFDTLDKWMPDLEDSNSGAQMSSAYRHLSNVLALGCNVAVVCVLHLNKQHGNSLSFDGISGSVKTRGSADLNLVMVREAPDDDDDTRVVLRREGRDPWGMVRRVCGRLPNSSGKRVIGRQHGGPSMQCYRLVGQVKADGEGREYAHAWYQREDVPGRWQENPDGAKRTRKWSAAEALPLDVYLVRMAYLRNARDNRNEPASERSGVIGKAVGELFAQWRSKPDGYTLPSDTRVRKAAEVLVSDGVLAPRGRSGKYLVDLDEPEPPQV